MQKHAARLPVQSKAVPVEVRLLNLTANALFAVAALLAVGLLWMWLVRQPMFSIRVVRVEGDVARNSASTIRANAYPKMNGNYFTLDLKDSQRAFETVPWVRQAVVQRVWPDRLVVRLEENRAVALWAGDQNADRLVAAHGDVFQANIGDVEDESLPTFQGPEGSSGHILKMHQGLVPLFASLDMRIETLSLSGRGSWRVQLDNGAEVVLGRGTDDELLARTQRFLDTVDQVISRYQRPLIYADLRHNEGYAVRLRGISTTLADPSGMPRQ